MTAFAYIVVEDESLRTPLFSLLSSRSDLLIGTFRTGGDFLAALPTLEAGIVLLDIGMSGMSGLDVMEALRTADRGFCGVIVTGRSDVATAVRAMKLGAVDFIEKPHDPATLFSAIDAGVEQLRRHGRSMERARRARALIGALSDRERAVLGHLIDGKANKAVAILLNVSPRTVEVHRANLMNKLGVDGLAGAIRLACAAGMLEDA